MDLGALGPCPRRAEVVVFELWLTQTQTLAFGLRQLRFAREQAHFRGACCGVGGVAAGFGNTYLQIDLSVHLMDGSSPPPSIHHVLHTTKKGKHPRDERRRIQFNNMGMGTKGHKGMQLH